MANQTAANVLVALKRETVFGTAPATVTGADRLRIIDSPGLEFNQGTILSTEKRADGVVPMGRLGSHSVTGSYNTELTVGGAVDSLLEAIMRSTYTAAVTITQATLTSITTPTTSTIVAAAGSWISEGVKEGDVVRLTNHSTAANNDINLRALTVTASTLTVVGAPLTVDAVPDASFELTILKKVVTNTTAPDRYSYAIDQNDVDLDDGNSLSELFLGCRLISVNLAFRPNSMATVSWTFMGVDRTQLATGTSPFYTTPSLTTGLSLVADDSSLFKDGVDVTNFTGFDLTFTINAGDEPVIGAVVSPNVFDNDLTVAGVLTGIRQDFSELTLFSAETEFALGIMLEEPGTAPVGTISFFLPRVKIAGLNAPVGGGDGAKIETLQIMAGPAEPTTTLDGTVATIQTSAS